jgi:hypothetical protein
LAAFESAQGSLEDHRMADDMLLGWIEEELLHLNVDNSVLLHPS